MWKDIGELHCIQGLPKFWQDLKGKWNPKVSLPFQVPSVAMHLLSSSLPQSCSYSYAERESPSVTVTHTPHTLRHQKKSKCEDPHVLMADSLSTHQGSSRVHRGPVLFGTPKILTKIISEFFCCLCFLNPVQHVNPKAIFNQCQFPSSSYISFGCCCGGWKMIWLWTQLIWVIAM